MGGVTSSTVLTFVTFAMRVFAEVIVEILGERSGIAGDFATLKTVPDGDAFLVGVYATRGGSCHFVLRKR